MESSPFFLSGSPIRYSRRDLSLFVISLLIILNAGLAHTAVCEVTIQRKDSQRMRPSAVNRPRELHFIGSKEFYGYFCREGAAGNDNAKLGEDS